MRRNLVLSLVITVAVAALALGLTIVSGSSPELGLDLQGGASVVLQPKESVDSGVLDQTIGIIRNRVDALGVAEPEITRQGNAILVELPGVKDQERALEIVGQTAELRFRPVLELLPPDASQPVPSASTTTVAGADDTSAAPTSGASPTDASADTTVTVPTEVVPTTPPAEDDLDAEVVLEEKDGDGNVIARYRLGPTALTGAGVEGGDAQLNPNSGTWSVAVTFKEGEVGIDGFNQLATRCFNADATCPPQLNGRGMLAITLDSVVKSAPTVQQSEFEADDVSIT
ncbi:MAG: hypothetical protein EHM63_04460, partial [Actinobacteria bacterium]